MLAEETKNCTRKAAVPLDDLNFVVYRNCGRHCWKLIYSNYMG